MGERYEGLESNAPQTGRECLFDANGWLKPELEGLMKRITRGMCRNQQDVEDALQEAALRVLRYADRYNPERANPQTFVALHTRWAVTDFFSKVRLTKQDKAVREVTRQAQAEGRECATQEILEYLRLNGYPQLTRQQVDESLLLLHRQVTSLEPAGADDETIEAWLNIADTRGLSPEEATLYQEYRVILHTVINEDSNQDRRNCLLQRLDGAGKTEIAVSLGLPPNTVGSHLNRGCKRLRQDPRTSHIARRQAKTTDE